MSRRLAPVLSTTSGGVLATNRAAAPPRSSGCPGARPSRRVLLRVDRLGACLAYSSPYPPLKITTSSGASALTPRGLSALLSGVAGRPGWRRRRRRPQALSSGCDAVGGAADAAGFVGARGYGPGGVNGSSAWAFSCGTPDAPGVPRFEVRGCVLARPARSRTGRPAGCHRRQQPAPPPRRRSAGRAAPR